MPKPLSAPDHDQQTLAPPARHWSGMAERGLDWGLRFSALVYRVFGRTGCLIILAPAIFYFLVTGSNQRQASRAYLSRVMPLVGKKTGPGWIDCYRHFLSFAGGAIDTFAAWSGRLPPEKLVVCGEPALDEAKRDGSGAMIIVSHLGNADLSRALLDAETRARLTVMVHTRHAIYYNEMLRRYNPAAAVKTIQVTETGPDTIMALSEQVESGEWIVIAGDRTAVGSQDRTVQAQFLGQNASFAQGPYIIASLLKCPVYLLFCIRGGAGYELYMEKFADRLVLPRQDREGAIQKYAQQFADRLERYVKNAPLQWYNFFDFWA